MFQGLKHLFSLSFIKLIKNHYLSVDHHPKRHLKIIKLSNQAIGEEKANSCN